MDTQSSKPLKTGDTLSRDEGETLIREHMTDETAQAMGYPSAKVWFMEDELAKLAREWHRTHDETVLSEYHKLYYKMIVFGYPPEAFAPETEIDTAYMPELPTQMLSERD